MAGAPEFGTSTTSASRRITVTVLHGGVRPVSSKVRRLRVHLLGRLRIERRGLGTGPILAGLLLIKPPSHRKPGVAVGRPSRSSLAETVTTLAAADSDGPVVRPDDAGGFSVPDPQRNCQCQWRPPQWPTGGASATGPATFCPGCRA